MRCPRCQHENPPSQKFCGECGAGLASICPSCRASNPPGQKFCGECGAPLAHGATARFATPETYTPKHLAERILTSKAALEGERKQVTVLFADLKGSMELLADRDPEEARKILDPVLEQMMEAVHRYEGTVNQVMGDGIMALFGAPLAHEDHAVRACYAALRMQEAVKRHAEEVQRAAGIPIQIRVGLNSGEVVVRSIGSDLHMDYTAVGQTTHLAARMEQMAMAGSIIMTADTLRFAEGYVQVKPLGPVNVKGFTESVEVYAVTGAGSVRTRLQASAARGLTRFVGRDAEVEQLRRALEKAGQGQGQVVAVVGEPGVGKSRLFYEFTGSHRTHGWLILESGSVSYGMATPYLPVIDLLKAYFQIETRDDSRKIREKVTGKLLTLDRALEPSLPALFALLDVPIEDAQWQALAPPQRRQRSLEAVKRLLLRESQVQPLLLVFEDLHWIDSETQVVLDNLVESVPSARLLLLVNYRPEYQHGWGSKTYYTQLRIDPLPSESAEELLQSLLGGDTSLRPLMRVLLERTEGNPFFLEESVRTLIETQVLTGERGAHRLAKEVTTIQVAPTVQAVLAARIDRLPPEDKRLLQAASVIGEDVPFLLLEAIAELPEEELRGSLAHLGTAEFLYETKLFPDLEYSFKHALTNEVAYASLLQDRRRALHRRIVEAVERLHAGGLDEQAERLAYHALRGEVWGKAVSYLRQAGARAVARSAHQEAVVYLEQALAALEHLPAGRDTLAQTIDLRLNLRTSLLPLGEQDRLLRHLQQAEASAVALGDQRRLGWVACHLSNYFWIGAEHERALEWGQQALSIAATLGDRALDTATKVNVGRGHQALGDYVRAMSVFKQNVASLEGDLLYERFGHALFPSVSSRVHLVQCLAETGEFAEGSVLGQEAVRIAERAAHPFSLMYAHFGLGILYLRQGALARAIPALERGLDFLRFVNSPIDFTLGASALGLAYALWGRVVEALPLLEERVEQATTRRALVGLPLRIACLSESYLLADRVEDAGQLAGRALVLSRDLKERGHEGWALRLLGEVAAHRVPPDGATAESHYRQAMALADDLGMRPLVAHCHLGLGKLHRRTGKQDQAREHLSTATTMYREMGMTYWLEQAKAKMRECG